MLLSKWAGDEMEVDILLKTQQFPKLHHPLVADMINTVF